MAPTNREAWLTRAAEALIERFGVPPRGPWRVTCSWPSKRVGATGGQVLGQCFSPGASRDGTIEIIVSITLDDPLEILNVVAHELGHAHLEEGVGHRAPFARLMKAMGLEGKPTATVVGPAFAEAVAPILEALGPYPHASLDVTRRKKQSTRMKKAFCPACGYTVRLTRKWIEVAVPRCPIHDVPMTV